MAYLHSNRTATLPEEARRLCRGVVTKALTKMAYWNPVLDFAATMKSLPDGADLTVPKERIKPIIDCIDEIKEGGRPAPGLGIPFFFAAAGSRPRPILSLVRTAAMM